MTKKKEALEEKEKESKIEEVETEEVKEVETEDEDLDSEDEGESKIEASITGFGEMSLSLGTNKQVVSKTPKNLEDSIEEEIEIKEVESAEKDYEYNTPELEEPEEEEEREEFYGVGPEDEEDEREGPYATGEREGSYRGNPEQELYNAGAGPYAAGNGNGNGLGAYDPRTERDNPMETDVVKSVRFDSGLEHRSKKVDRPKMHYDKKNKKRDNPNPLYK